MMEHYLCRLHIWHKYTTIYHSQTSEKIQTLNCILGDILTNYLTGKSTKLWDKYLLKALFVTKIKVHSILKYSQCYLLYGQHHHLSFDDNPFQSLDIVGTTTFKNKKRIFNLQNAQSIAHEALLKRTIKAKKIREEKVKEKKTRTNTWRPVGNNTRQRQTQIWVKMIQTV